MNPSFYALYFFAAVLTSAIDSSYAQNQVSTYAGDGTNGYADGDTSTCRFKGPFGMCMDQQGNLYIADNSDHRIRKIAVDGTVTTLAGTGAAGYVDGPGATARFNAPSDLCADADGNIYVSDFQNQYIRKITPDGTVSTVAGSGIAGYLDGAAGVAQFNYPRGICIDAGGNLFVGDSWNHRIRKIDVNGNVSTLAGGGDTIGVQSQGNYKDANDTLARFNVPCGMSMDADGNLYVADAYNHRIRKVTPDGLVSTVAGTGDIGSSAGGFEDGSTDVARFNTPTEVYVEENGNIYVGDTYNNRIRLVANGEVTTVAGNGIAGYVDGDGSDAEFKSPRGIVSDVSSDHLFICDNANHVIRKITLGTATAVLSSGNPSSVKVFPNPAGNEIIVSYQLPEKNDGVLEISNLLGEKVMTATLPHEFYAITVDISKLPSSLYLYRVSSDKKQIAEGKFFKSE